MSEMVERLKKRALATGLDCENWADEALSELVRALIAAMREPTKAMCKAGAAAIFDNYDGGDHCAGVVGEGFTAMIDAALADNQ